MRRTIADPSAVYSHRAVGRRDPGIDILPDTVHPGLPGGLHDCPGSAVIPLPRMQAGWLSCSWSRFQQSLDALRTQLRVS